MLVSYAVFTSFIVAVKLEYFFERTNAVMYLNILGSWTVISRSIRTFDSFEATWKYLHEEDLKMSRQGDEFADKLKVDVWVSK